MKKCIILNDTRRNKNHLGCKEVMLNIEFLCAKNDIGIIASYQKTDAYNEPSFSQNLDMADMVIINGEGTMHHDQLEAVQLIKAAEMAKRRNLKIYLINSVWQDNFLLNKHLDLFDKIYVRESFSLNQVNDAGYQAKVVPDLSIFLREPIQPPAEKTLQKIVFDSVSWRKTKFLAKLARKTGARFHTMGDYSPVKKLKIFSILFRAPITKIKASEKSIRASELVISGRFHALCLSIKNLTPCICIASNTHKTEGVIKDIGLPFEKYIIKEQEITISGRLFPSNSEMELIKNYRDKAQIKILDMFRDLK